MGGMGEVYRATDTNLKRQVAIKVLPSAVATDSERLARFQREAEVLASLNHPNIAGIHGLERADGQTALVMELVEGPTLADRIAHGPIPLDEALPIAKQIAEALEAAHDRGIIHRDLKPANIKVRPDGTVKVLDFGLAKALEPGGTHGGAVGLTNSPTMTSPAMMTGVGVLLGTAAYMSPEQAKGRVVDKRSDVWAFGAVLYEMLTARRAFEGDDVSDTLARILMKEPDWTTLPAGTPAPLRRLLRRCLEKDRKRRLDSAADARLEIEEALTSPAAIDGPGGPTTDSRVLSRRRALPWTVAAIFGAALVSVLVLWAPWRAATVSAPRRLQASIGAAAALQPGPGAAVSLSPDGTTLAFVGQQANLSRLFVRPLDQLLATPLAGTEGAASPFFSPDGRWIAFFADGKLKKVAATGGAVVPLCDAVNARGGTWSDNDTIIFAAIPGSMLMRVGSNGGTPTSMGAVVPGPTTAQQWPQALPRRQGVLYTEQPTLANANAANVVVVPLSGGTPKVVVRGSHFGRYVPTGHLVYLQRGTLFAVRFDLDRLETVGEAVPAVEGVLTNLSTSGAQVAFSPDGTLVYVPGVAATLGSAIDWLTRDGMTSVLRQTKADWASPRFSPDGQKLALDISDGKQRDIWVYEWASDRLTQLTFDPGQDTGPHWSPDGRHLLFSSDRAQPGVSNLYLINADGTGDAARLTDSSQTQVGSSWHPSGKFVSFMEARGPNQLDLMILPMDEDAGRGLVPGKPTVFWSNPAVKVLPAFSPDGRWIAYASLEAGGTAFDVYVRPFPGPGGMRRVSYEGGGHPRWSVDSRELLFFKFPNVMVAPYNVVGDSFNADKPRLWTPTSIRSLGLPSPYDIHPDGKRLAVLGSRDEGTAAHDTVVFVFNFFDYLRKLAPATN